MFDGNQSMKKSSRLHTRPAYQLEERLIMFAVNVTNLAEKLPPTKTGNHVAGQLIRSSTSPAPNYGEAQSAESRRDFIHKIKVCLKELREVNVWLRFVVHKRMIGTDSQIQDLLKESDELIAIFVKSVATAKNNAKG